MPRRYSQVSNQKLALLNTLKYSVWSSRGAGLVLAMDGFLIMLAVCRNLIRWLRPKIRFIPLDENLWFHRQTAYMLLLFAIIHTTAHYVNFFVFPSISLLIVGCWESTCSTCYRVTDPLCGCRRDNGTYYVVVYASHVYHCPHPNSKTVFRSILVYASSCIHLCLGIVHPCHRMFRTGYKSTIQSPCRWNVLVTLYWLRRMESNSHQRLTLLLRKSMASHQ